MVRAFFPSDGIKFVFFFLSGIENLIDSKINV